MKYEKKIRNLKKNFCDKNRKYCLKLKDYDSKLENLNIIIVINLFFNFYFDFQKKNKVDEISKFQKENEKKNQNITELKIQLDKFQK